jgi:SAM-dependent methyltransferase
LEDVAALRPPTHPGATCLGDFIWNGIPTTQYAHCFETHGIDYNEAMIRTARKNLARVGNVAHLCRARVEALPYEDESFDTIVNTMAFSGYPDARQALAEMRRVLRRAGWIVLIDVNYPTDGNWIGMKLTGWARRAGDLIRDLPVLFDESGFTFTDEAIGGYGSVHLYIAEEAMGPRRGR